MEREFMKVIIAGSRSIKFYEIVKDFVDKIHKEIGITEVVSGKAKGVDSFGERWAKENGIPVAPFPADWKNLSHPDAVIKEGPYGLYDALAGHRRNVEMGDYGDFLICLIHNGSSGSSDMIDIMKYNNKHGAILRITSGSRWQDFKIGMAAGFKEERF